VRAGAVVGDLILFSRIAAAAEAAGTEVTRVDAPAQLAAGLDLVLVDWSARRPDWSDALRSRRAGRIVLFGPHTDLEAHAAARAAGLGPMWARSKLVAELPHLMARGASEHHEGSTRR
jgi:hypothetical protein